MVKAESMRFQLLVVLSAVAGFAFADDGVLYDRGGPRLLKGGSQVRMIQEFVRIKVFREHAAIYCRFELQNTGPATSARIGFPDGSQPGDPEDPSPVLTRFRSSVDGNPLPTSVERAPSSESFAFYHVKRVRFQPGQTRTVEDWYESPLDGGATSSYPIYVRGLNYIMSTGGSWKGKLHQATVEVVFLTPELRNPQPEPLHEIGNEYESRVWKRAPKNIVFWEGFAEPRRVGHSLVFQRRLFKPDQESDIHLAFGAYEAK